VSDDEQYLAQAEALAREGVSRGDGGPFGAVIVAADGTVVGRGWNRVLGDRDPTAHAEVMAIRDACGALRTHVLDSCTIYSTCEPCPMCLAALHWARLDRCVYAMTRDDAAKLGFDDAKIYEAFVRGPKIRMEHHPHPPTEATFRSYQGRIY